MKTDEQWSSMPPAEKRRYVFEAVAAQRGLTNHAFYKLLPDLLEGLHWNGGLPALVGAMPYETPVLDAKEIEDTMRRRGFHKAPGGGSSNGALGAEEIETTMARLGFRTVSLDRDPGLIPAVKFPALLMTRDRIELVRSTDDLPPTKDLAAGRWTKGGTSRRGQWRLFGFIPVESATALQEEFAAATKLPWRGLEIGLGFAVIINLLALIPAFYTKIAYDRVIGGQSLSTLFAISLGTGLALIAMLFLRWQRASYMAWTGSEFARRMADWSWEKLCALPMVTVGRLPTSSQLNRIKDIERQRDLVSGPLAIALTDLPFVVFALAAIAWLGGWIVLAPIVGLAVMALLGWLFSLYMRAAIRDASTAMSRKNAMLQNACSSMASLRMAGDLAGWKQRFLESAITSAEAMRTHATRNGLLQAVAQGCTGFTALITLAFGIELVLHRVLTPGGLIATMLLIWRVLAAPQAVMVSWSRLGQLAISWKQMQALGQAKAEVIDPGIVQPLEELTPSIEFSRVSVRFDAEGDAALSGVSFKVEPGELVAVLGRNGAGKSTLLKTVTGLYAPVAGSVLISGRDIRQFEPRDLRVSISYLAEKPVRSIGSVRDKFWIASPLATDEEMLTMLRIFAGEKFDHYYPKGLDTMVTEDPFLVLSPALNCITLARAFRRRSKILLLDEPLLTDTTRPALKKMLAERKGHQTILLVTKDEDLIMQADKAIVLDAGALVHAGPISKIESNG